MKVTKEVIIQNVHSELVLTANILQNTQSESPAAIRVTQDIYEKNWSGQRFKQIFCNLHFNLKFSRIKLVNLRDRSGFLSS